MAWMVSHAGVSHHPGIPLAAPACEVRTVGQFGEIICSESIQFNCFHVALRSVKRDHSLLPEACQV